MYWMSVQRNIDICDCVFFVFTCTLMSWNSICVFINHCNLKNNKCIHIWVCLCGPLYLFIRIPPSTVGRYVYRCVCMEMCVFSRLEFSIIPKGQLQHSRCSFIPRREYWAIRNCSYHSYWTIALIAVRVWVPVSVKRAWGWDGSRPWETELFTERLQTYRCMFSIILLFFIWLFFCFFDRWVAVKVRYPGCVDSGNKYDVIVTSLEHMGTRTAPYHCLI